MADNENKLDPIELPIVANPDEALKGMKSVQSEADKLRKEGIKKATQFSKKENKIVRDQLAQRLKALKQAQKKGLTEEQKAEQIKLKSQSQFLKKKIINIQKAVDDEIKLNLQAQQKIEKQREKAEAKTRLVGAAVKIGIGVAAIKGFTGSLKELANESVIATNKIEAMEAVIRSNNQSVSEANRILDALTATGLVNREDMAEAIRNLTSFGFSLEQTNKFLKANLDLAIKNRESHYSLSESIVTVTRGLKNNNSILADATGVSENLSVILKKAGLAQTALNDEVTAGSARIAILNKFLADAAAFEGDAAKEADKFSGSLAMLTAATEKVTVSIGIQVAEALKPVINVLVDIVKSFGDWFAKLDPISKKIIVFTGILAGLGVGLIQVISGITQAAAAMKILGITASFSLGPIALIAAALGAITLASVLVSESVAEMRKEQNKAYAKNETDKLVKQKEAYVELAKKVNKTKEEKEKLASLESKLVSNVEGFTTSIDNNTSAIEDNIDALQRQIALQEEQAKTGKGLTQEQAFAIRAARLQQEINRLRQTGGIPKTTTEGGIPDLVKLSQQGTETSKKIQNLQDRIKALRGEAASFSARALKNFNAGLAQANKNQIRLIDGTKILQKEQKKLRKRFRGTTTEIKENNFYLTKIELQIKNLTEAYDEFRKSAEGDIFDDEGFKRFQERLESIGEQAFGFMPGIFQDIQREVGSIDKEIKQVNEDSRRWISYLSEQLKTLNLTDEQLVKIRELQKKILDNAKRRQLSLEFERANIHISKAAEGMSALRDGISAAAENDMPRLIQSAGGLIGVFDKAVGGIISSLGIIVGAVVGIISIITDNTDELEKQRREQERIAELQEQRLDRLRAEQKLQRDLIKLEQERKQINLDYLDLQEQVNEALGLRREKAQKRAAKAALKQARRLQAEFPELEGIDLTTQSGLKQASKLLKEKRLKNAEFQSVVDLATSIQGSIVGLPLNLLGEKINELETALMPVRDIDQETGGRVSKALDTFKKVFKAGDKILTPEEYKAAIEGKTANQILKIQTRESNKREAYRKLQSATEKEEFGFENISTILEAEEANLADIIRLALKGVGINAELAVSKVEDILEAKARKVEGVQLFEEDEIKRAKAIFELESDALKKAVEKAVSAGIDLQGIDLFTKKGYDQLLKIINDPKTNEYQVTIIELLIGQIKAVENAANQADENANKLNTTLAEFSGERGLSLIVDVAEGYLRDQISGINAAANAVQDMALPDGISGGISQIVATSGQLSIQEQSLDELRKLRQIQENALDVLLAIAETGVKTGLTSDDFRNEVLAVLDDIESRKIA